MKDSRPLAETSGLLLITIFKGQNLPSTSGDSTLHSDEILYPHLTFYFVCGPTDELEWVKDLAKP